MTSPGWQAGGGGGEGGGGGSCGLIVGQDEFVAFGAAASQTHRVTGRQAGTFRTERTDGRPGTSLPPWSRGTCGARGGDIREEEEEGRNVTDGGR